MKYDPVEYRRFERDPIGAFTAQMTTEGWGQTKFDHESSTHLLSDEVGEFVKFVQSFFKECEDWPTLQKFVRKHGTEITDDYNVFSAVNFVGDRLDYTMHIAGTAITIFPYRKIKH